VLCCAAAVSLPGVVRAGRAAEADPERSAALIRKSEQGLAAYAVSGNTDRKSLLEAMKAALDARKLNPRSAEPHVLLGKAYLLQNKPDLALERAIRARELEPENAAAKELYDRISGKVPEIMAGVTPDERSIKRVDYKDGSWYVGGLLGGERNGYGFYAGPDSTHYIGQWKNDVTEGHGVLLMNSGTYIGEWKNKKKNGHGIMKSSDGRKDYVGQIADDFPEGHGVMQYPDGSSYAGQFKHGDFQGHGVITYVNGDRYAGEFKKNKKQGGGALYLKNGDTYVGLWDNDRPAGGYFFRANGQKAWSYMDKNGTWVHEAR
jgi:hypothetical protein